MNHNELKRIVLRRQLQVSLIVGIGVFFVGALFYTSFSVVERPCDDGCPEQYTALFEWLGLSSSDDVIRTTMYSVLDISTYAIIALSFVAFFYITFRLWRDITRFVHTSILQQQKEREAETKLKLQKTLVGDDGELFEIDEEETVYDRRF